LKPAAELRDLEVADAVAGGPVTGSVTVVNKGNTRLNFDAANDGALAVVAGSESKRRVPFAGVLYPRQARQFRLSWLDPPALGRFRMRASVQTASGLVTGSEEFWIVPWRQTVAVLLVAVAALVFAAGRRRKRSRA
jgi:hypothetical protein